MYSIPNDFYVVYVASLMSFSMLLSFFSRTKPELGSFIFLMIHNSFLSFLTHLRKLGVMIKIMYFNVFSVPWLTVECAAFCQLFV